MIGEPLRLDAVCAETAEVFALNAKQAFMLMDQYPGMGYLFYQRLIRVVQRRLDLRTEQFVRVITKHPHIKKFTGRSVGYVDLFYLPFFNKRRKQWP